MSLIVSKRNLAEAVQALVKARQVNEHHLSAVFQTLAQVASDVTGESCELVLRVKQPNEDQPLGYMQMRGAA